MNTFDQAAFSPAGPGTPALGFGPHLIRNSADQTGGRLEIFEADVPPGEGPPPHVHEAEDEVFRVLGGRFAFWCHGDRVDLEAGGVIAESPARPVPAAAKLRQNRGAGAAGISAAARNP